jgi:neurotransmitter:Na+ symporter, NSS family
MSKNQQKSQKLQDQWSSRWSFILATTGAAVGLGNVWRFPYMAGTNGGSAFVLVYLICVVFIGLPIMIAEILIGRRARQNPISALQTLAKESHHSRKWGALGWWGALALLMVLSFYSVVSGWSIAYLFRSIGNTFHGMSDHQIIQTWQQFLASPWQMIGWQTLFLCLTISVVIRGVQQGIEKATRFMMPALYVILFVLVFYAATVGDFKQAFHFLFAFNLEKITPTIIVAAMGHAFFTLALGAGAMLTYGAYVPNRINIANAVWVAAALDVLVAILSGLAIFPLVFAHHLAPNSGPGLMFVTLPIAFSHITGGALIGGLFFLLLLFAAWTASLNLTEPMVIILMNRLNINRRNAALLVGTFAWVLGIGSALSFNVWRHLKFLHQFTVFDIATNVPTDIILPLGGLGFALFAGWIMKKKFTQQEVHPRLYPLWRFLIRYVAPTAIIIIFISAFF